MDQWSKRQPWSSAEGSHQENLICHSFSDSLLFVLFLQRDEKRWQVMKVIRKRSMGVVIYWSYIMFNRFVLLIMGITCSQFKASVADANLCSFNALAATLGVSRSILPSDSSMFSKNGLNHTWKRRKHVSLLRRRPLIKTGAERRHNPRSAGPHRGS